MKATLEFDIPDEEPEFNMTIASGQYLSALCEIDRLLRAYTKYEAHTPEETLDLIKQELIDIDHLLY